MNKMIELKFKVPDEVKQEVEESPEFHWSEFLAKAIQLKAFELEMKRSAEMRRVFVEALSSKSKLSEEEADKFAVNLGRKIKKGRFEKLKQAGIIVV